MKLHCEDGRTNKAHQTTSDPAKTFTNRRGRPHFIDSELITKVNQIVDGSRLAGIGISVEDVVHIGNSVFSSNSPNLIKGVSGGLLELTIDWARRNVNYTLKKATTKKRKPLPNF